MFNYNNKYWLAVVVYTVSVFFLMRSAEIWGWMRAMEVRDEWDNFLKESKDEKQEEKTQ